MNEIERELTLARQAMTWEALRKVKGGPEVIALEVALTAFLQAAPEFPGEHELAQAIGRRMADLHIRLLQPEK